MLDISKISIEGAHTDGWLKHKNGKFSASNFGKLIGEKSDKGIFTSGAMTYIEGIAGERLTGKPARFEFSSANTDYGNATEAEAISYFQQITGKTLMRNAERSDTHRLIINDDYSACTPDSLVCLADEKYIFDETGQFLKVAPLEVKCPPTHHKFLKMFKCTTPLELSKVEPIYYWQCITQLVFCDSPVGWFAVYNPDFPVKMRVIEFRKINLVDDIKRFKATLTAAKLEVDKIVNLFK